MCGFVCCFQVSKHWCVSGSQFNNSFPTKLESWIHCSSSQQCARLTILKTEAIDLFFILQNTWGQRTVCSSLSSSERQKMILFSIFILSSPWQSILNPLQKKKIVLFQSLGLRWYNNVYLGLMLDMQALARCTHLCIPSSRKEYSGGFQVQS